MRVSSRASSISFRTRAGCSDNPSRSLVARLAGGAKLGLGVASTGAGVAAAGVAVPAGGALLAVTAGSSDRGEDFGFAPEAGVVASFSLTACAIGVAFALLPEVEVDLRLGAVSCSLE